MENYEISAAGNVPSSIVVENKDEEIGCAVPVKRRSALLTTFLLAYESIGVVYGDLGTSPLYVYNTTFVMGVTNVEDVIGVTSLVMWLLIMSPLVKYCFVVLTCDDNGEGGTFASYGLLARNLGISRVHGGRTTYEQTLSQYTLEQNPQRSHFTDSVKKAVQGSSFLQNFLLFLALLATCMLIGDGILTPAQSVLSAIGGINNNTSLNQSVVVGISCGGLFLFYCAQQYGTSKIGFCFAPIIIAFLVIIATVGVWNIARYDAWFVFKAFSPHYGIAFLIRNGKAGWIMLGGVFLTVTGTEAMYADLGHFSDKDKQVSTATVFKLAFSCFILPCLVLGYLGQAAWLTQVDNMPQVSQCFFLSLPQTPALYWPIFVIATAAAAVASQSIVTATFSIVHQAMALGCFPRMTIMHTSAKAVGQIYIPEINFVLCFFTILITAVMGQDGTTTIGNAYGIAVSGVMIITTILVTLLLILVKRKSILLWLPFLIFFFCAESVFLSANLYKMPQGGWVPLAFAGVFLFIMFVWHYGSGKEYEYQVESKLSHDWLTTSSIQTMGRVPGLALFYSDLDSGIPPIFLHFLSNVASVHSVIVFIAVKRVEVPTVLAAERFSFKRIGASDAHIFRCLVRYGYKEIISEQSGALAEELVNSLVDYIRIEEDLSIPRITLPLPSKIDDPDATNDEAEDRMREMAMARRGAKEEEVQIVMAANAAGVKHILGRIDIKAKVERTWQSILNRFVIDYAYRAMKVNTRDPSNDLGIPNNTLEVGMKVFV